MVKLICHGCGDEKNPSVAPKEFVCSICGAVNIVPVLSGTHPEACGCLPPTSFEWRLPLGVNTDPMGVKHYKTAQNTEMTKEEFINAFGCDPDIVLERMRELGIEGQEGFVNLSTLGKKKVK